MTHYHCRSLDVVVLVVDVFFVVVVAVAVIVAAFPGTAGTLGRIDCHTDCE